MDATGRHLPGGALIEAYGHGGFRFAGMSHRGALLCLPGGVWASDVTSAGAIGETDLRIVLAADAGIDHFLIGTGKDFVPLPRGLRETFRARHIVLEAMATGAAVHTYNILVGEHRRVGALFIAVD